jgi:hypothetical protein
MKLTKEQQIKLWKEFKKLKSDKARWKFILNNQGKGIKINLDNDDTFGSFSWDENGEYLLQLDDYLGWSDGIQTLLSIIGIDAECV